MWDVLNLIGKCVLIEKLWADGMCWIVIVDDGIPEILDEVTENRVESGFAGMSLAVQRERRCAEVCLRGVVWAVPEDEVGGAERPNVMMIPHHDDAEPCGAENYHSADMLQCFYSRCHNEGPSSGSSDRGLR